MRTLSRQGGRTVLALAAAAAAAALLAAPPARAAKPNPHNSLDCLFCHETVPKFGIDTRETITFYRYPGDDPRLCYNCHSPEQNLHPLLVRPGAGNLGTRPPESLPLGRSEGFEGMVVCTTCHFLHAADAEHTLLRGFVGTQEADLFYEWRQLCRQCHGDMLEKRSPHGGDERSCAFCHAATPKEGTEVTVMPRGVSLCNFCHGVMQGNHLVGINPFEGKVDCLSCHNPHFGPDRPGRLKQRYFDLLRGAVTVNPHGRRTLCSCCHVEDAKFTLMTQDKDALCNRCHASGRIVGAMHPTRAIPPGKKIPDKWPTREGRLTCLSCHLPGHEGDAGGRHLLRGGPYESLNTFCDLCHDYTTLRPQDVHKMIADLKGCEQCHDKTPVFGRDTAQTVTFLAPPNMLCLRCHQDVPHPANITHTVAMGDSMAARTPSYLLLAPFARITCATCHNPHLVEGMEFKLRKTLSGMQICIGCHGY